MTNTEQAIAALEKLHKHLEVFTAQDAPWYDETFVRIGTIIAMLKGEYDPSEDVEQHQYAVTVRMVITMSETYQVVAPTMADAEDKARALMKEDAPYLAQHPQHPHITEIVVSASHRVDVEKP